MSQERRETQSQKILKYLQDNESITALEALDQFGCFRLAARINDLKKEGHDISSVPVKTPKGATISSYSLVTNNS